MKKKAEPTLLKSHIKDVPDMQKLLHKRKKIHRYFKIFCAVAFCALVVGSIIFLRDRRVQIYSIKVSGNEIIDTDLIVSSIQKNLSGKYFYLIPKTNIFFYPKQEIYNSLKKDFPRFNSINVSLVNKTTLSISVTEERGTALWCGDDNENPDMSAKCYFADKAGKIIDTAPYYSGNVYLKFFGGSIASSSDIIGRSFVDEKIYDNLLTFAHNVIGLGFQISAVRIGTNDNYFFVLDLDGTNTAYVEFNKNDDYGVLFSNLKTALGKTELSSQVSANKASLQYFDLRFTNKVYYKFNDSSISTKEQ